MNLGLRNKLALVTGGARGLGAAIATALADEGATVVVTTRRDDNLVAFRASVDGGSSDDDVFSPLTRDDKTDGVILGLVENLEASLGPCLAWQHVVELLGGRTPDILVNNVGDTLGIVNPHATLEDYRRVMRVNFEIAMEMSEMAMPAMKAKGWGRIVHISSNAGLENSGPVPYCAAKAALTSYGRSMGRLLATEEAKAGGKQSVVMSVVHPGVILTEGGYWDQQSKTAAGRKHSARYLKERCPLGRFGRPDELAPMVVMLCSEQATFMQGAVVPVDAGQARHYFEMA